MLTLKSYQNDLLNSFLSSKSYDLHGTKLANAIFTGNIRIENNGDILLTAGRGIKWNTVGIAFGLFGTTPTVSFYTGNVLQAYINNTGIVLPSGKSYYVTSGYGIAALSTGIAVTLGIVSTREAVSFYTNSTVRGVIDSVGLGLYSGMSFYVVGGNGIATSDLGIAVTLGTIGGLEAVGFYTNSTLRGHFDSNGLTIVGKDIVFDTAGKGIGYSGRNVIFGTFNSKDGIGIYTSSTLRSYFNVDGITLLTAGAGLVFASGGTTGYYGTSTSLDLYISGTERAAIANNSGSSVNSPLYLDLGGTLSQVKYDNSDLGSGAKKYLYIA